MLWRENVLHEEVLVGVEFKFPAKTYVSALLVNPVGVLENERRVEGRPSPINDHGRFGRKSRVANLYKYK